MFGHPKKYIENDTSDCRAEKNTKHQDVLMAVH